MVPVRTSLSALLTGGVMIGALAVAAARHGLLIDAPDVWTLDSAILLGFKAGGIYVLGFAILHVLAQQLSLGQRAIYAGMAAVATIATMLFVASGDQIQSFIDKGYLLASLGGLGAFGAIVGFLYYVRAGYCAEGDNPHSLDGFLRSLQPADDDDRDRPARHATAAGLSGKASEDRAHIQTETAEYFDGPLQVRTSFGTMIVSALAGTLFFNFGVAFMGFASWLVQQTAPQAAGTNDIATAVRNFHPLSGVSSLEGILGAFANSAAGALLFGLLLAIPFAGVIYACHMIARAMDKTSYTAYALIGFAAPPVLGMLLFFVFFVLGIKMAFPCAIAMVIYRSYAGLEPKHVAEDIMVHDRRHLVGANHARRRYGRVIASR